MTNLTPDNNYSENDSQSGLNQPLSSGYNYNGSTSIGSGDVNPSPAHSQTHAHPEDNNDPYSNGNQWNNGVQQNYGQNPEQYPSLNSTDPHAIQHQAFSSSPATPTPFIPVWVTILVTILGSLAGGITGLFGIFPAYIGEKANQERGLPPNKHWKAFGITMAISIVLGILLFTAIMVFSVVISITDSAHYSSY